MKELLWIPGIYFLIFIGIATVIWFANITPEHILKKVHWVVLILCMFTITGTILWREKAAPDYKKDIAELKHEINLHNISQETLIGMYQMQFTKIKGLHFDATRYLNKKIEGALTEIHKNEEDFENHFHNGMYALMTIRKFEEAFK